MGLEGGTMRMLRSIGGLYSGGEMFNIFFCRSLNSDEKNN